MTIDLLRQYNYLKREIKDLEDRIANINSYTGINYDRVGSRGGGNISNPVMDAADKKMKLENKLQDRLDRAQELLIDIEDYVDTIDDSLIRQAITYHYLQGNSWRYTARVLTGGTVDENVLSNMVTRYVRRSETITIINDLSDKKFDENDEKNIL